MSQPYIAYRIGVPDENASEIVIAELAELGFESFSAFDPADSTFEAYIPLSAEQPTVIAQAIDTTGYTYTRTEIAPQNWNAVWEADFPPITVTASSGEVCHVRAPFHPPLTDATHQVVIMPKMSFGTGHHATTAAMVAAMLEIDFRGTTVLDMGSGTGILAILAAQRGGVVVDAVDIDAWAYENCLDNIVQNSVQGTVCPILGNAEILGDKQYDIILANINRNILLADMWRYVNVLRPGGLLLISGFLPADTATLITHAQGLGLTSLATNTREGWAQITLQL